MSNRPCICGDGKSYRGVLIPEVLLPSKNRYEFSWWKDGVDSALTAVGYPEKEEEPYQ